MSFLVLGQSSRVICQTTLGAISHNKIFVFINNNAQVEGKGHFWSQVAKLWKCEKTFLNNCSFGKSHLGQWDTSGSLMSSLLVLVEVIWGQQWSKSDNLGMLDYLIKFCFGESHTQYRCLSLNELVVAIFVVGGQRSLEVISGHILKP